MKPIARLLALAALSAALALPPAFAAGGLPKAASPAEAAEAMARPLPGLEIVDLRPADEFADYSLPGSLNLDASAVLADETLLAGSGPLLLVDKDGTAAFAVAGVLARKAQRPVWALTGGLAAWWADRELGMAVKAVPLEAAPGMSPGAAPSGTGQPGNAPGTAPATDAPRTPSPAPAPPAAKNAGC